MSHARRLASHYLDLPFSRKVEVIRLLGVDFSMEKSDEEMNRFLFSEVHRLGRLHELWRAVESRHPDGKPDENPFPGIADRMVAKAKLKHEMRVLDPCVGDGEIVRAAARIAAVKFDALARDDGVEARMLALRPIVVGAGGTLMARQQDILSIHPEPIYDAVFMNMGAMVLVRYAHFAV